MVGKRAGVHTAAESISSPASERRAPSSHGDGGGGVECDCMRCYYDGRAPSWPTEATAQRQERLPATIGMDGADERSRPTFGKETILGVVEMDLALSLLS